MNAAPRFRARAILASAGSGKTYQLASAYIDLLRRGVGPERILATTFTRKAAAEIFDRILKRLADEADAAPRWPPAAAATPDPAPRAVLTRFVRNLHRAQIGTLDAFCARLAGAFAFTLALPPSWRIIDEDEDARLRADAAARALEEADPAETAELLRALHLGGWPAEVVDRVLAAVGDAHTTYLASDESAWGAVPRAHTRGLLSPDALRDALDRLRAAPARPAQGTHANFPKARDKITLAAESGDWEFVATALLSRAARTQGVYGGKPLDPALAAALDPIATHATAIVLRRLVTSTRAMHRLLHRFDDAYTPHKLADGLLRFDDIPRLLLDADAVARLDEIYYRLDARIDHVLLDEFQDTSIAQFELLRPLLEEILAGGEGSADSPAGRSLFIVGDAKQSMYTWRNAEPELFDAVLERWPQIERETLSTNRRSAQSILDFVNRLFEGLATNPAFLGEKSEPADADLARAWADAFPHHTRPTDADAASSLPASHPGGVRLRVMPSPDAPDTDAEMLRLRAAVDRVVEIAHAAPRATIGILLPRRKHLARLIYELAQRGIPASQEGGNPLTDAQPVAAILSLIQALDHPADSAARFHVASSPLAPIVGMEDWRDEPQACAASARWRRAIAEEGLAAVIARWRHALADRVSARDDARLAQLVNLARRFDARAPDRLRAFVDLVESTHVESSSQARVRVMTIHASKGLEFDAVLLPELDTPLLRPDGLLTRRANVLAPIDAVCRNVAADLRALDPELEAMGQATRARDLRERLCVLYVAITRARLSLDLFVDQKSRGLTYASILRGLLTDAPPAPGIALHLGDDSWTRAFQLAPSLAPAAPPEPVAPVPLPPSRVPRPSTPARSLPTPAPHATPTHRLPVVSPSSLHLATADASSSADADAAARGVAVHAFFEQISWIEDLVAPPPLPAGEVSRESSSVTEGVRGVTEEVRLPPTRGEGRGGVGVPPTAPDPTPDPTPTNFLPLLAHPSIRSLLSRDRYASWHADRLLLRRETAIAARVPAPAGDRLLLGRVDRLVVAFKGPRAIAAEVIDFKSDRLPIDDRPTALASRAAAYRPQIDAYRLIIAQQFNLPLNAVQGTLAFLDAAEVITWSDAALPSFSSPASSGGGVRRVDSGGESDGGGPLV